MSDVLLLLLVGIPGYLGLWVVDFIGADRHRPAFDRNILSIVLGIVAFAVGHYTYLDLTSLVSQVGAQVHLSKGNVSVVSFLTAERFLPWLSFQALIAVSLGFAIAWLFSRDCMDRMLKVALGRSIDKYLHLSLLRKYAKNQDTHCLLHMKSGHWLLGTLNRASDVVDDPLLYLLHPVLLGPSQSHDMHFGNVVENKNRDGMLIHLRDVQTLVFNVDWVSAASRTRSYIKSLDTYDAETEPSHDSDQCSAPLMSRRLPMSDSTGSSCQHSSSGWDLSQERQFIESLLSHRFISFSYSTRSWSLQRVPLRARPSSNWF